MNATLAGLLLLFGVVQCFAGYKLLRFAVVGTGFGVGAAEGFAAVQLVSGAQMTQAITGGLLGLVFAWLTTRIYLAGVFMLGAAAGTSLAVPAFQMLSKDPFSSSLILLAIVSGILAVILQRWAVIFATVIVGAAMCAVASQVLRTGKFDWQHLGTAEAAFAVVLILAGGFRQLKN